MQTILSNGLKQLDIDTSLEQQASLINFTNLLLKWNKVYNLTAVRELNDMVRLHLLDSLSLLPFIVGSKRIIDVGSGGGLPGIPLAIFNPNVEFVLLDSNIKKTRFIKQACIELALTNVEVVHSRVEKYKPDQLFDCLMTRAFSTISQTLTLVDHLLADHAKLLFMKSNTAEQELNEVSDSLKKEIVALKVPGIDAPRTLAILTKLSVGDPHV